MNSISDIARKRLAPLEGVCDALIEHALRCAEWPSRITAEDTLELGHAPWIAPEAYLIRLFAPAEGDWLGRFSRRTSQEIPADYRRFLLTVNGCDLYKLRFHGLAPSMQRDPPLLDGAVMQPLDLDLANGPDRSWRHDYANAPAGLHFASRPWAPNEIVGYFRDAASLVAIRRERRCRSSLADARSPASRRTSCGRRDDEGALDGP